MKDRPLKRMAAYGLLLRLLGIRGSKQLEIPADSKLALNWNWSAIASINYACSDPSDNGLTGNRLKEAVSACDAMIAGNIGMGHKVYGAELQIGEKGEKGYSRSPLQPAKPDEICDLELAIVCYLARSHCRFFDSGSQRDFDAAKLSLNDIHQADQLAWRLYSTLPTSHLAHKQSSVSEFLIEVIASAKTGYDPKSKTPSSYFVWSALLLCEISRGNIFRQLSYLEQADRHYRHAEDRYARLHIFAVDARVSDGLHKPQLAKFFVTRALIRALNERAKIRFDLGQFLESLITHVSCLQSQIRLALSEPKPPEGQANDIVDKLERIKSYLDAERVLPMFDRGRLHCHFGNLMDTKGPDIQSDSVLTEKDLEAIVNCIPKDMQGFCADVIARIGFTLFTMRPKQYGLEAIDEDWMNVYFRVDKKWNDGTRPAVPKSPLGQYCETFFAKKKKGGKASEEDDDKAFENDVDRRFALILRSSIPGTPLARNPVESRPQPTTGGQDPEAKFYADILQRTTENISNILTVPRKNTNILMRRGYKYRVTEGDVGKKRQAKLADVCKLVILRRWQSYNPRIPKRGTRVLPGGGYLLFWRGRGMAIDPGYDFLQNLYDQGFSLEDIDAVIVTHSHPDHDDDLSTLTTLVKEWNEYHYEIGAKDRVKRLDIFLNESCERKFSAWLQASKVRIGRVIPLPVVCWNRDTEEANDGPFRGENATIDLRPKGTAGKEHLAYNMVIEIVPAWHDDVIGKTSAVGLKFHMFAPEHSEEIGVVGYTGDTGAFGLDVKRKNEERNALRIDDIYRNCDVIIAHLGDVRLRELATVMQSKGQALKDSDGNSPLASLTYGWMRAETARASAADARDRLHELFDFMITLKLVPAEALKAELRIQGLPAKVRVQEWLGTYFAGTDRSTVPPTFDSSMEEGVLNGLFDRFLATRSTADNRVANQLRHQVIASCERAEKLGLEAPDRNAYLLIEYLVACSQFPWLYPYHLGLFGIYRLYEAIGRYRLDQKKRGNCVFIVGELPEELSSYRHRIAYLLDRDVGSAGPGKRQYPIKSFTGDIGLHIKLGVSKRRLAPTVRCNNCNYNNELVAWGDSYHGPKDMVETEISRYGGAMIYLCKEHYPGRFRTKQQPTLPEFFLSRPNLRVL